MGGQQAVRRTALQETSDVRAQNTRSRLIEAYQALMAAGAGPVSALAVCRAAGVARSTFYTHYETIEDLAVASLADAFAASSSLDVRWRATHDASSRDITRAGLTRMIGTLEEQRAVILATTRLASRSAIVGRLVAQVGKGVRAAIEAEDAALDEVTVTTTTEFVAAGTVYASLQWLEQSDRDPQVIVDHLMNLMPPVLTAHEARPEG